MVLRRALAFLLTLLALSGLAATLAADDKPAPNEVILPLHDYLALVEKGEAATRERARAAAAAEAPVAEVAAQRLAVTIGDAPEAEAELFAHFEALIEGHPKEPLLLPFQGLAVTAGVAHVEPLSGSPALTAAPGRGLFLVSPAPGRYAVDLAGRAAFEDREGVRRLTLAPVAAAVAEVAVDLPADLAWSAPGAVVVEETVTGARRAVRLGARRGEVLTLDVQRRLSGTEAEKLLAQSVVLTLFQLRPDGVSRHDVVLYEVSRGSLPTLAVDLPPGLMVEQVATDEGDAVPVIDAQRLTVHRKRQLAGIGYLVLTSTPASGATLPASAVVPGVEVRARYLAVASSVAADLTPQPAASWSRVDLSDLPPALGEALQSLDLSAAWRLSAIPPTAPIAPAPILAVALLPPSPRLPTLVRRRETTTLVTVDGTVLHRDRFTLDQAGSSLDLTLPAGAVLWSAKVGEQPVRPVERGGGLSVPLGFAGGVEGAAAPVVEVVSVVERTIPKGRSELRLALAEVTAPVSLHQWRLLLPEGPRYRWKSGDLKPVHEAPLAGPSPGMAVDGVNVGGSLGVAQPISTGATVSESELANIPTARDLAKELKQGMVGGVKPLPVTIPETGKALLLSGALPPARIGVELEVKGKR
jgi:hypothetical protein